MTKNLAVIKRTKTTPLTITPFRVAFFHSIFEVNTDWDKIAPVDNVFLQRPYLQSLEQNPPVGMQFGYFMFYKNHEPVGIAIAQVQNFKADESLNNKEDDGNPCFFSTFARYLKGLVASKVDFNTIILGNVLLTGEHGFYFKDHIDKKLVNEIMDAAANIGFKQFEKKGIKTSLFLLKDFHKDQRSTNTVFQEKGFREFTIQPSMIMDIRPEWKSFEDYLGAMTSKYRVRAKRAMKKAAGLTKVEMNEAMIEANVDLLYDLYCGIAENSGFNAVNLNKHYLLGLKKALGDDFKLVAFYDGDQLIGYLTAIRNHSELEAHFLGFDKSRNRDVQIYLNILYELVRIGIDAGLEKIVFARTALAIKSSVGAVAHEMYCYMKHQNAFSNKFTGPILDYLKPTEEWEPRHPFK